MIIKVKNAKDSWSYFECEIIHSKYDSLENMSNKGNAVVLLEARPIKNELGSKQVKVFNLETKESHLRTIITNRVCYILNNEGKTIDRV